MSIRRYPGVSPFTEQQKNIFFGRDNDIKKLQKLISLRNQILIYAKSGIGKTSLLNAGVLPKLEKDYTILKIRFYAYNNEKSISPVEEITNIVKNISDKNTTTILNKIADQTDYKKTLWHYFKQLNLRNKNSDDFKFIIVFDQFEELFSYPQEQIQEFKEQLQQLINDNLPTEVKQFIADNPDLEDETDILFDDLKTKTVFAIRSDRLSLINKLTDKLPNIQKNFYELKPLENQQARQAIIKPASDSGNFETPPFVFKTQAIEKIIDALSNNQKQNIETTQLQIICQRIEDIAQEKATHTLKTDNIEITEADLPKFEDIFFNFYENSVAKTKNKAETQKFIEDQLIRNNQRISLDEIICHDYVNKEALKTLTDTHLLRAERNSTGGFSYELSHDTLIEPILISRKKRIEKEEEEEQLRIRNEELRIAKEKAEKERIERNKERKRQRTIIIIVSIAAVVSILFGVFGFVNMQKAEKTLKQLTESQFNKYIEDANRLKDQAKYEEAIEKYNEAQNLIPDISISKDSIIICLQKLEFKDRFNNNIIIIDSLINIDKFEEAILLANTTSKMDYNNDKINEKIKTIKDKGSIFYYTNAKQMYYPPNNEKEIAKEYLNKALDFAPNNKNILEFKETYFPNNN